MSRKLLSGSINKWLLGLKGLSKFKNHSDVRKEIFELAQSQALLFKAYRIADRRARLLIEPLAGEDLFQIAIMKLLDPDGGRQSPIGIDILTVLNEIMKSEVSNRNKRVLQERNYIESIKNEDFEQSQHHEANDLLETVQEHFAGDEKVLYLIRLKAEGYRGKELEKHIGGKREYEKTRKRFRRGIERIQGLEL